MKNKRNMKKMLWVVLLMVSTQGFSQGILDRLYFGLKAGGNYSDLIKTDFGTKELAGFHAGAIVGFKITNNLMVHEEFLFSTQGAKSKNNAFVKDIKLSYASIPLLLRYHSFLGIYIEAGPQVNLLVKDFKDSPYNKFAERIDVGGAAGLGYQFRSGPVKGLGIGARYYRGLSKVGKFHDPDIKSDFKNSMAQLSIFYVF